MSAKKKEVLVVFGKRRRPVTFEANCEQNDNAVLLKAVLASFSDIVEEGLDHYLQVENEKYGLIDLVGEISDGAIVHLCQEQKTAKVKSGISIKNVGHDMHTLYS